MSHGAQLPEALLNYGMPMGLRSDVSLFQVCRPILFVAHRTMDILTPAWWRCS